MAPTDELQGEALEERARELDIEGRSEMSADELRSAVADAEGSYDGGDVEEATESNKDLEHTEGGMNTRQDPLDQGVPMLQGSSDEPQGPEDALGEGPKRGDYRGRVTGDPHESVRTDDGSDAAGELVENDDGGIERKPHTKLVPQRPRVNDIGDAEGEKGGVDTDPRS